MLFIQSQTRLRCNQVYAQVTIRPWRRKWSKKITRKMPFPLLASVEFLFPFPIFPGMMGMGLGISTRSHSHGHL